MSNRKLTYQELEKEVFELELKLVAKSKLLDCMFELSRLIGKENSLQDILIGLSEILKKSLQFPEITEVKITNEGFAYKTENFKETQWIMRSEIIIEGKAQGEIQIVYLENKTKYPDPFLKEEYNLLNVVSERLGREIAHIKKNMRYEELFETLLEGIIKANEKGIITEANNGIATICGYRSPKELVGRPMTDLYAYPETRTEFVEKFKRKDGDVHNFEFLLKRKDNTIVTTLCSARMLFNCRDEYIGTLGTFRDISERKKIQKNIEESEAKYSTLFSNALYPIWLLNKQGVVLQVNKAASDLIGYTMEDLLGMKVADFEVDQNQDEIIQVLQNVYRDKQMVFETRHKTKDGKVLNLIINTNLVFINGEDQVLVTVQDITPIRNAEKALKESEEKYRRLVTNSASRIMEVNVDTYKVVSCNPAMAEMIKLPESMLIGKDIRKILPPDVMQKRVEYGELAARTNKFVQFEDNRNGRYFLNNYVPYKIKGQNLIQIVVFDITEQKKTEIALKESEEKFREIIHQIADGLVIFNNQKKIVVVNNVFKKFFDVSNEEILNMNIVDFQNQLASPEYRDKERLELIVDDIVSLKNEEIFNKVMVHEIFDKNKNQKFIESVIFPIKLRDSYLYCSLFRDVTKRKQTQKILEENESRLKSLVTIFQKESNDKNELIDVTLHEAIKLTESNFGAIYFYDSEKKQFDFYPQSEYCLEDGISKNHKSIFNLKNLGILWEEVVQQEKPIIINDCNTSSLLSKEYIKNHPNLKKILAVPVFANNSVVAVVCVANKKNDYAQNDILHLIILMRNTLIVLQKNEKDEFIRKQNSELIKLNSDKDRFISILAHDLKNPFNSLLGFSQILSENIKDYSVERIRNQVSLINASAKNMYILLDDILLWFKSQSGKIVFEPDNFNLDEACRYTINDIVGQANAKGVLLKCNISAGLKVFSDINIVKTILRNLTSNAIKFTNKEGTVTIEGKEYENEIIISIIDTGVGIEKENLSAIFNVTNNETANGTDGESSTGLGLQICKEFVELIGGRIGAESEVGKGSVFYFTIPKQKNI